jgi:hypothetical protein
VPPVAVDSAHDAGHAATPRQGRLSVTAWRRGLGVVLVAVGGTVLVTWPLVRCLGVCLGPPPDTLVSLYFLHWVAHALTTPGVRVLDAPMFAPYRDTLTLGEYLPAYAPLAIPVLRLTGNPVAAHNVVLLTEYAGAALGVTLLARRLVGAIGPALVAGAAFAFSPRLLHYGDNLQTLSIGWTPWIFLAVERFLTRPTWPSAITAAALGLGLALSSMNVLVFTVIGLAVFVPAAWVSGSRPIRSAHLVRGLLVGAPAAVLLWAYVSPYRAAAREWGLWRTLAQVERNAMTLGDYVALPPEPLLHRILGTPAPTAASGLLLGVTLGALAVVGLLAFRRAPQGVGRALAPYVAAGVVALGLAAGPSLRTPWGDLSMPYRLLYAAVPGFDAIRTPNRLLLVVDLTVALLAAAGLADLSGRLPVPRRAVMVAAAGVLILAESVRVPFPGAVPRLDPGHLPPVYRWLATAPPSTVALGVPMGDWANVAAVAFHLRRTVNGWASWDPPRYAELVTAMDGFPDPRTLALVRAIRPDVILVDRAWLVPERAARLARADSGLRFAGAFDTHLVYRLDSALDGPALAVGMEGLVVRATAVAHSGLQPARLCAVLANSGSGWLALYPVRVLRFEAEAGGGRVVAHDWLPLDLAPGSEHRTCVDVPALGGTWRLAGEIRGAGRVDRFAVAGAGEGDSVAAMLEPAGAAPGL